jgi:iron complex outermembrane receptor protein
VSALVCFAASGTVPILAQGQETPTQPTQQTQPTQGEKPAQKALRIEETQVTGERDQEHDYRVQEAATATKTDTPLRNTPQSVQVIDRQVIEDRQVVRLSEVADNVSGAQYSYGGLSSADYYIRGFPTFGSLRNGFRDFGFISPRDVANIVSTGTVQHSTLLGVEIARYNFSYHFFGATIAPIDIASPSSRKPR